MLGWVVLAACFAPRPIPPSLWKGLLLRLFDTPRPSPSSSSSSHSPWAFPPPPLHLLPAALSSSSTHHPFVPRLSAPATDIPTCPELEPSSPHGEIGFCLLSVTCFTDVSGLVVAESGLPIVVEVWGFGGWSLDRDLVEG